MAWFFLTKRWAWALGALAASSCAPHAIPEINEVPPDRLAQEQASIVRHRASWTAFDADGDGALSRHEWRNREWAYYLIFDLNNDGFLSASEYMRAFCGLPQDRPPEMIEGCRRYVRSNLIGMGFVSRDHRGVDQTGARSLLDKWFDDNDRNRDGLVSTREYMGEQNAQ